MESPVLASHPAAALPLCSRFSGPRSALVHTRMGLTAVSIHRSAQPIKSLPGAALHVTAPAPKTFWEMVTGPPGRFSRL